MTATEQQSDVIDNNGTENNANEHQPLMGGDVEMVANVANVEERVTMKLAMACATVFLVAFVFVVSTKDGLQMTSSQNLKLYAACPEMEGYMFYKHRDSSGNDLRNVGDGHFSREQLADWCDQKEECLGFNTGGYMKSKIKEVTDWIVWGADDLPCAGLYVKSPCQAIGGYTFYDHEDSSGSDITNVNLGPMGPLPPDSLGSLCNGVPDCAGFNTDGWFKSEIKHDSEFTEWGTDTKCKGLYVKHPCDFPGYNFYNHMDSPGGDFENLGHGYFTHLLLGDACNENPYCVGFNTDGWIKTVIHEKQEWNDWQAPSPCKGLYVRNDYK